RKLGQLHDELILSLEARGADDCGASRADDRVELSGRFAYGRVDAWRKDRQAQAGAGGSSLVEGHGEERFGAHQFWGRSLGAVGGGRRFTNVLRLSHDCECLTGLLRI